MEPLQTSGNEYLDGLMLIPLAKESESRIVRRMLILIPLPRNGNLI